MPLDLSRTARGRLKIAICVGKTQIIGHTRTLAHTRLAAAQIGNRLGNSSLPLQSPHGAAGENLFLREMRGKGHGRRPQVGMSLSHFIDSN